MADESTLWSDKLLQDRLFRFLDANRVLLGQMKVTPAGGEGASVIFLRCHALDQFLDLLEEKMFTAKWGNLHDALAVFLVVVLLKGDLSNLNQRNARRVLLDILTQTASYEIKTKAATSLADVPSFLGEYYADMVASQGNKTRWWLLFFQRRGDAKGKIGESCTDYLVVIEVVVQGLEASPACQATVTREVMDLVEQAEKQARTEDGFEDNAFVPVPNYALMDRLRRKNQAKARVIEAQAQALEEKDQEIAELKKRLKQFEPATPD